VTTNVQTAAPCEFLPWDSNFFELRIARVKGNTLDQEKAEQIEEWSRTEGISALYFLARADSPATIRTAEETGFQLLDVRVTLERSVTDTPSCRHGSGATGVTIRPAVAQDIALLKVIAEASHSDTRFFSDPHFPREKARELYSTWIQLECAGRAQAVLVATSSADHALAYISCHIDPAVGCGQIGLVGVSEAARGKGLGSALVLAAVDWFRQQRAKEATVVTQGRNVTAQRLYQRCGFVTRSVQLWYHKWYPASARAYA